MKKMIRVKVGQDPFLKKSNYYPNGEYLDYGCGVEFYPTGKLSEMISHLSSIQKKYRDRYQNLSFQAMNDCGCPYECSCSPSYILYGDRYETEVEYKFRLAKEQESENRKKAHELKILEELKRKYET